MLSFCRAEDKTCRRFAPADAAQEFAHDREHGHIFGSDSCGLDRAEESIAPGSHAPSLSDMSVALPPEEVVSIETVRSVEKRSR